MVDGGLLKDRRIVVSGASRGIGFEIARCCAEEGAKMILVARKRKDLEKTLKSIPGTDHRMIQMDIGIQAEVACGVNALKKQLDAVDGLVNCAGIIGAIGRSDGIDEQKFIDTIRINLLGTFHMCRHFIPLLLNADHGKIINFSGGGATGPFPNYTAYAVSKVGIVKLTENLAEEFRGMNLDVNAVAPGFVATGIHRGTIDAGFNAGEGYLNETLEKLKNGGIPAAVPAALTMFLLSSESDGISGKLISACWDPWEDKKFRKKLRQDRDFATLRRIDGRFFVKKR